MITININNFIDAIRDGKKSGAHLLAALVIEAESRGLADILKEYHITLEEVKDLIKEK